MTLLAQPELCGAKTRKTRISGSSLTPLQTSLYIFTKKRRNPVLSVS